MFEVLAQLLAISALSSIVILVVGCREKLDDEPKSEVGALARQWRSGQP